jgi:hypothetical protein
MSLLRGVRRATGGASVNGIALPFTCGFLLRQWLPETLLPEGANRLVVSQFLATALSTSSVKNVAVTNA